MTSRSDKSRTDDGGNALADAAVTVGIVARESRGRASRAAGAWQRLAAAAWP